MGSRQKEKKKKDQEAIIPFQALLQTTYHTGPGANRKRENKIRKRKSSFRQDTTEMVVATRLLAGLAGLAGLLGLAAAGPAPVLDRRQQATPFVPRPGYFPPTGDDTIAGGIFCISLPDLAAYLQRVGNNPGSTGSESPR